MLALKIFNIANILFLCSIKHSNGEEYFFVTDCNWNKPAVYVPFDETADTEFGDWADGSRSNNPNPNISMHPTADEEEHNIYENTNIEESLKSKKHTPDEEEKNNYENTDNIEESLKSKKHTPDQEEQNNYENTNNIEGFSKNKKYMLNKKGKCLPPPLQHEWFTCYPPEVQRAPDAKCPELECSGGEEVKEGECCRADENWVLCWKDSKAVVTYDGMATFDADLRKCETSKCTFKEWDLKSVNYCLHKSSSYELVCAYENKPELNCVPYPVLSPDVFQCTDIICDKTGECKIPDGNAACCQHENYYGATTCCLKEEFSLAEAEVRNDEMQTTTIVPSDLGEMKCHDMKVKPPNYLQCPKFVCHGKISGAYGYQKHRCCTFEAMGISWVCCKDTECSKSFDYTYLPKCREIRCDVRKSVVKDWMGKGCCEDNTGSRPMTCCFETLQQNKEMIKCFPRSTKKPEYLKCTDMEKDTIKICQISIFRNKFCCLKEFPGGPKSCCVGALIVE